MPKFDDHILESKRYQEFRQGEQESLIRALAKQNGYTYVDLHGISINPAALVLVPEEEAGSWRSGIWKTKS